MTNSKQKGKRGELELAHYLTDHGIKAKRGVQYQGSQDSPDVVTDMKDIHIECKRNEKLNIYKAIKQAIHDAGNKIPCVMHRRNKEEWLVTMRLDDWIRLYKK